MERKNEPKSGQGRTTLGNPDGSGLEPGRTSLGQETEWQYPSLTIKDGIEKVTKNEDVKTEIIDEDVDEEKQGIRKETSKVLPPKGMDA